jgi:hypothetical protein
MEYVHNNMQSKTINTFGHEFCISTNTNPRGKKYTRPWKMRINWIHIYALPFHIHKKFKKERNKYHTPRGALESFLLLEYS